MKGHVINPFSFNDPPVNRSEYAGIGVLLTLLKYAVEAVTIGAVTGQAYTPIDFVNPSIVARSAFLVGVPECLGIAWLLWTLPFLVIALAMSVRRTFDVGASPWWALWVLVPLANIGLMIVLAALPTKEQPVPDATRSYGENGAGALQAAVLALLAGVAYVLMLSALCVYVLGDYGVVLFYGCPFVVGAAGAYLLNSQAPFTVGQTLAHAFVVLVVVFGVMLLLAMEGVLCLAMAAPLMVPMSFAGALAGREIAIRSFDREEDRQRGMAGALLVLPLLGVVESKLPDPPERMVETSVVVDAAAESVWDTVIAFPPIDAPEAWYFRLGIASPQSAFLEGSGVGAVRYCVFTTGEFVEPITVWDAPHRLAFDVAEQPEPMFELTPYREIHPPHLHGALESTRGEFRLEPLPDGSTLLVGRTWYRLRMAPTGYWALWTEAILHRVHHRVLDHIRRVTEAKAS